MTEEQTKPTETVDENTPVMDKFVETLEMKKAKFAELEEIDIIGNGSTGATYVLNTKSNKAFGGIVKMSLTWDPAVNQDAPSVHLWVRLVGPGAKNADGTEGPEETVDLEKDVKVRFNLISSFPRNFKFRPTFLNQFNELWQYMKGLPNQYLSPSEYRSVMAERAEVEARLKAHFEKSANKPEAPVSLAEPELVPPSVSP